MRHLRFRVLWCAGIGLTLLLSACGENGTLATDASPEGVDREAILNDLADVRALLEDATSEFSADIISDVEFNDNQLTVTVTEQIAGIEDAEALCDDLSEAIAAADVEIAVLDEDGANLATCRFEA